MEASTRNRLNRPHAFSSPHTTSQGTAQLHIHTAHSTANPARPHANPPTRTNIENNALCTNNPLFITIRYPNTIHQTYPSPTMKNQRKTGRHSARNPTLTQDHTNNTNAGVRGDSPRKQEARGRKTKHRRKSHAAPGLQHAPHSPTASSRTSARPSRLCENAGATQNKTPKPHKGYACSHDKNTDPTTTGTCPTRSNNCTHAANHTRPSASTRIGLRTTAPTRRNAKDPSCLHDSALPHHNPARRAMHRRKSRGQAATREHAERQRYLSTLPLIRPHLT